MNAVWAADLALLFCAFSWGLSFPMMKVLVAAYPACWLLSLRFSAGALMILAFFHRRIFRNLRHDFLGGAAISAALFFGIVTQTVALRYMGAGRQAFLSATYVLMVPLILWGFRRVFPGWITLLASCVCLGGMGLLTDLSGPAGFGDALTLLSALLYAFQILAISRYTKDCDPLTLSFVEFGVTAVLSLIAGAVFEGPLPPVRAALPELAATIVLCTFGCYVVQVCAQKYSPPSHASLIMCLESVFGLLGGIVFLGESLTPRMGIGCALIFASVLLAELEPVREKTSRFAPS